MSRGIARVITGSDVSIRIQLYARTGKKAEIDLGATVKAVLRIGDLKLHDPVTCSSGTAGADWPNGLVVVSLGSSVTETLPENNKASVEIDVNDGSVTKWIARTVEIIEGLI